MANKTFSEMVSEIVNARGTKTERINNLVRLGIPFCEAERVYFDFLQPKERAPRLSFTFGVEIECSYLNREGMVTACRSRNVSCVDEYAHYNHTNKNYFKIVRDGSLDGSRPGEFVSPVLNNKRSGIDMLKAACESLRVCGAEVNKSCGLHVHIGAKDLTEEQYVNVFVNYMRLEKIIDSFMQRSRRGDNAFYAKSVKHLHPESCSTRADITRNSRSCRYYKVNPHSYDRHKTIEFRQHGGSTEFEKISNWVMFLGKLVEWSKSHRIENCECVNDIPFLNAKEKAFFNSRVAHFAAQG